MKNEPLDQFLKFLIEATSQDDIAKLGTSIPVSDPQLVFSKILRFAAMKGASEEVEVFIPHADPKADNSAALLCAARNGHLDCVKLLWSRSDVSNWSKENWNQLNNDCKIWMESQLQKEKLNQSCPKASVLNKRNPRNFIKNKLTKEEIKQNTGILIEGAREGDADKVKRFIKISDAKMSNSMALRFAASFGHAKCVELLIPESDTKEEDSWTLYCAAQNGHVDCVKLLWPHSDVSNWTEKRWNNLNADCRRWIESQLEKEKLDKSLPKEKISKIKNRL